MKRFVYDSEELFNSIRARLLSGERIVVFECEFPTGCNPDRGKIYFYLQPHGVVMGICDMLNSKTVQYTGANADLRYLIDHQAIEFDNLNQIRNIFYRIDAVFSSNEDYLVYYVDGYGYENDGKYVFKITKHARNDWRAYIVQMPSLGGRNSALSETHRLYDSAGYYVCVLGKVETKKKMIAVAKFWATRLRRYIKTGQAMQ